MRKMFVVLIAVVTIGLWFAPRPAEAQEGSKESGSTEPAKPKPSATRCSPIVSIFPSMKWLTERF